MFSQANNGVLQQLFGSEGNAAIKPGWPVPEGKQHADQKTDDQLEHLFSEMKEWRHDQTIAEKPQEI